MNQANSRMLHLPGPCGGRAALVDVRSGTTLIELMIVMVLISVGWMAFLLVAVETVHDYDFFMALNLLARWNQKIVNDVRDDTLAAKQYFENDSRGIAYFNALFKDPGSLPVDSLRLPVIDDTGELGIDSPADPRTGNSLFFVKTLTPFVATVPYTATETYTYRVNLYCFVLYYLTLRQDERIADRRGTLDLIRWRSRPVADYTQIMAIEDPDGADIIDPRAEIVAAFVTQHDSTWLWSTAEDVANAFYECDEYGQINASPEPDMVIPQDPDEGLQSAIPATPTRAKRASVGFNSTRAGWDTGPTVPILAMEDPTGDGFPHGFEVQICGPSGSREILVRMVLAKGTSRKIITREFAAVLTTRDF